MTNQQGKWTQASANRMMRGLIAALKEHHALYPVDKDRQPLKPKLP
jgi:hypothetical protein